LALKNSKITKDLCPFFVFFYAKSSVTGSICRNLSCMLHSYFLDQETNQKG